MTSPQFRRRPIGANGIHKLAERAQDLSEDISILAKRLDGTENDPKLGQLIRDLRSAAIQLSRHYHEREAMRTEDGSIHWPPHA